MAWDSIVAKKRAIRDATINEIADTLATNPVNDDCNVPVSANISIPFLVEQLSTGKLSVETLVSATINRYVGANR